MEEERIALSKKWIFQINYARRQKITNFVNIIIIKQKRYEIFFPFYNRDVAFNSSRCNRL